MYGVWNKINSSRLAPGSKKAPPPTYVEYVEKREQKLAIAYHTLHTPYGVASSESKDTGAMGSNLTAFDDK